MKCLVVGNFTVDIIDNKQFIGGSSYYSGWSLKQLGCDVYVLTTVSSEYRELFRELYDLMNIIEYTCSSNPVFIIEKGRAVGLKKPGCLIPSSLVLETFSKIDPDILLLTPVYREVDLAGEEMCRVLCSSVVKSLEIHGLTRDIVGDELVNKWIIDLFKYFKFFNIVHGNLHEYCFSNDLLEIVTSLRNYSSVNNVSFQVSMDDRGLYLVDRGNIHYFYPFNKDIVSILGAGDVLLAVSTHYLHKLGDIVEATKYGLTASYLKSKTTSRFWFNKNTIEENRSIAKHVRIT